jgi:hypothetical protein
MSGIQNFFKSVMNITVLHAQAYDGRLDIASAYEIYGGICKGGTTTSHY